MTPTFLRRRQSAMKMAFWMLLFVAFLLPSCSKNTSADAGDLLSTVPADASMVGLADVRSLLEKAGCKPDGKNGVELSPEVKKAIASIKDEGTRNSLQTLLSGEAGVAPTCAVFFMDGESAYITFMVDDPDKFKSYIQKEMESPVTATGGVETCGGIALIANQGWMSLDSPRSIDAGAVLKYSKLSESQSFASNECSERMLELKSDIQAWTDIQAMLNKASGSFEKRAMYRMVLSSIFDDAAYGYHTVNFEKGKMNSVSEILNSKYKAAKCNFSASKVDAGTINRIEGNADVLMAMSISREFSKQLQNMMSSLAGGAPGMYSNILKPLDGTAAFAVCAPNGNAGMKGVVSVDGKASTADLSSMLSTFGTVKRDGKYLFITKPGTVDGTFTVNEGAKMLDGCWFGMVAGDRALKDGKAEGVLDKMTIMLKPESGSVVLRIEGFTGKDSNALLALIALAGK